MKKVRLVAVLVLLATAALVAACASTVVTQEPPTTPASAAATSSPTVEVGPWPTTGATSLSGPGADGIQMPFVDSGFSYLGYGRFTRSGPDFFWRDGHFVNANGTPFEVSAVIKDIFFAKGFATPKQPTFDRGSGYGRYPLDGTDPAEDLRNIVHELAALGWWVRHTYIDSQDPLKVTFQLQQGDNGPFVEDILLRDVLLARARGLAIAAFRLVTVDDRGTETSHLDWASGDLDRLTPLLSLSEPAESDDTAIQATIEPRLPTEEKHPGCALRSIEVTGTFLESRRVTLTIGTTGAATAPSDVSGYAADVLALLQDLNTQENAGIAVLRFDAYDPSGTPLLQERHDLDLGRNSSTYAAPPGLPAAERGRLDGLDAAGVVHTYFSSGDYDVEYYLSAPHQQEEMSTQVREHEREGGFDDLVVDGPFPAIPTAAYSTSDWPEQVQFTVSYTSRRTSSIGEPPGKRFEFVYMGRQGQDRPWKVPSYGSGP